MYHHPNEVAVFQARADNVYVKKRVKMLEWYKASHVDFLSLSPRTPSVINEMSRKNSADGTDTF